MAEVTQPVGIPWSNVAERGLDTPGQGILLYHTAHSLCLDKVRVRLAVPIGKRTQRWRVVASTGSAPLVLLLL